ncbi:MAG: DMT family transporter [Chloroflexota bacterium]|nr:DMT family transporter [Chloroflexota bacterium]
MSVARSSERIGYLIAFAAAVAYGTNAVLTRRGLAHYGSPLRAIVIALTTGVLVLAPLAVRAYRAQGDGWRPERRALLFIIFSGLAAILGYCSNVLALSVLPVVVVAPISSTYPLVTVFLVRIFLRGHEEVNLRTALGAVCVVAGVILVTVFR